ncbi:hypothetical protein GCM10023237_36110 [Streptomyces coeruleoprunus]
MPGREWWPWKHFNKTFVIAWRWCVARRAASRTGPLPSSLRGEGGGRALGAAVPVTAAPPREKPVYVSVRYIKSTSCVVKPIPSYTRSAAVLSAST